MQQTVFYDRFANLDTVGQNKHALELARRDAAVQEHPAFAVIGLAAAYHQLAIFDGD